VRRWFSRRRGPAALRRRQALTRTSSFCYDMTIPGANCVNTRNTGLLNQEVVEPNTQSVRLETDYSYDSLGNKTQVTVSGVDIAMRSTTASFAPSNGSANGQFQNSTTNALNQTETWQYDLRFGKPTSHTGPNGLTTTWQYDTFGRKILEVRPDGNQTQYTYYSCANNACPYQTGSAYAVFTQPLSPSGAKNGPRCRQDVQRTRSMSQSSQLPFSFIDEGSTLSEQDFIVRVPAGIRDKETLLAQLARRGQFPTYFGYNWDALEECLADFSWIGDKKVIISHADLPLKQNERELRTYLSILKKTRRPAVIIFPRETRREVDRLDA
jgi:YD repeat-containing protein